MAEVLSQSQIDALLNAARSGDMDMGASEETTTEKRYRKYDFYSPRKFTKDRIKMLNGIFESYVRIITSRLNNLLHTACQIEVDSVEEQRYYEFSNALTEGDVLTLAHTGEGEDETAPACLHVTTSLMLSMIDRLLGGEGGGNEDVGPSYSYTDIELRLYENIVRQMVSALGDGWANYFEIKFDFSRIEVNPTLMQIIGLDETVVIIGINIKLPTDSGRLSICLPATMLTTIFAAMNREGFNGKEANLETQEEIFDYLRDTDLEMIAQFEHTELQMSDVYHLAVGDVIDLGQSKDSKVFLNIGGKRWFDGRMGVHGKNMAVKIDETYD